MPAPIHLSHRLVEKQAELRKSGRLAWLRPDAKSQVTVRYDGGRAAEIDTVVLSTQHAPEIGHATLTEAVVEEILKPVLPRDMVSKKVKYLVNPTGRFVVGGPKGDTGLTGRKIIVDTYGGAAPHGGGAFSGKDPSKVDRSAAYAARYVAKNVVAAGLARRCLVQVSYAIGVARPTSVMLTTYGTGSVPDQRHRGARAAALRPASQGHHPDARPAAADLPEDRGLWPLRARRSRLQLGEDRQGRRARGGRRARVPRDGLSG